MLVRAFSGNLFGRSFMLAIALLVAALLVGGCGGSDESSSANQKTGATGATSAGPLKETLGASAAAAYKQCTGAALKIEDSAERSKAVTKCQTSYKGTESAASEAQGRIDDAKRKAKAACKKRAEAISKAQARDAAVTSCENAFS